jgi:hypothetical protein
MELGAYELQRATELCTRAARERGCKGTFDFNPHFLSTENRSGMGAVYQAMDESLSCLVAVKETFAVTDEQRNRVQA